MQSTVAFISHRSTHKDFVRKIVDTVKRDNCIVDEFDFYPATKTVNEIVRNLNFAPIFVLLISKDANHLLKQRLLEELKNELLFANRNVNQLAEEFHFSDPSHLMRFFKRETGKTFTQYLRDYQNGIYE
jgi:hypothetical protein